MTVDEIQTICFVGAGTMGCANSLVAAVSGYDVVLNDARRETLDAVETRHADIGAFLVASGYCSEEALADALGRVTLTPNLTAATAKADLISESVFEDLDLKREIHRKIDQLAPASAILTTNTSALLVSAIEDAVERGDRFAALHSHLGALLFDIVGGPRTSPETIDILRRYVLSLGGIPLVLNKEHPGYVFNAMIGPLLAMSLRLRLEGHATTQQVDRAWMSERGAPMGPFGMMDLFGLDLILDTWRRRSDDPNRERLAAMVVPLLTDLVDKGSLGQKSGDGFYRYPEPAYQDAGFLEAEPVSRLAADALLCVLLQSAVGLASHDVASRQDVDLAWTTATGLGVGPFGILDQLGAEAFTVLLDDQVTAGVVSRGSADETLANIDQINHHHST